MAEQPLPEIRGIKEEVPLIKILHTEWSNGFGGQEKRILSEITGLRKRGYYVALSCRRDAEIRRQAERYGIDIYPLPFLNWYDTYTILQLVKILRKERFDIVNTHSSVDSWVGGIASKIAKVPVLIRTRHLDIPLKRDILHFIHYLPDMYITCGETIRKNLIDRCGFPPDKTVSIPTGVTDDFFNVKRNPDARVRYGLNKDSIVITNVGILRKVKGHEITLRAVKVVAGQFPAVKFLIVGDGPYRKKLEDMVDNLGIRQYVIFTGFVENIPEVYSFTDVAILSSWSEGIPQCLLQAMASGVPVVATEVGGVPEIVKNEKTGLLVAPGDYKGLAEGIIRIVKDNDFAAGLVENAKELVQREYSLGRMLDKIEDIYKKLLERKKVKKW